jgi:hypothetical protein
VGRLLVCEGGWLFVRPPSPMPAIVFMRRAPPHNLICYQATTDPHWLNWPLLKGVAVLGED